MSGLHEIHKIATDELQKYFNLTPVNLKHQLPERPLRALNLVKIDGDVFSTERLVRIGLLRISLPVYCTVYATFIRPRLEYDLPFFSCEVVSMGRKRMFLLDTHKTEGQDKIHHIAFYDRLISIRDSYPELMSHRKETQGDSIQQIFSKAVCFVTISENMDETALLMFRRYLYAYAELVNGAEPLSGKALENAQIDFDAFMDKILKHDLWWDAETCLKYGLVDEII